MPDAHNIVDQLLESDFADDEGALEDFFQAIGGEPKVRETDKYRSVTYPDGTEMLEYPDGSREWYWNDRRHREDGPAVEKADGTKEWWRSGALVVDPEYLAKLKERAAQARGKEAIAQVVDGIDWSKFLYHQPDGDVFINYDESPAVAAAGYAEELVNIFGRRRATKMGFYEDDNPGSLVAQHFGGADFVIIDGRYLADPWASVVENYLPSAVVDLMDDTQRARVRELYGDSAAWDDGPDYV